MRVRYTSEITCRVDSWPEGVWIEKGEKYDATVTKSFRDDDGDVWYFLDLDNGATRATKAKEVERL